jgi:hypothetical protein
VGEGFCKWLGFGIYKEAWKLAGWLMGWLGLTSVSACLDFMLSWLSLCSPVTSACIYMQASFVDGHVLLPLPLLQ